MFDRFMYVKYVILMLLCFTLVFIHCTYQQSEEESVCSVFKAWNLIYPVELSHDTLGDHAEFPWIRPTSMIKTMATTGDFPLLLGGLPSLQAAEGPLQEFWARYKAVFPQHGVFRKIQDSKGQVKTSQLLPILVHGDEGTTYKRGGMLVIQFSAVIGSGSNKAKAKPNWNNDNIANCGIPLNLVKNAMQTRFLTFLCPRDWGGFCPNLR